MRETVLIRDGEIKKRDRGDTGIYREKTERRGDSGLKSVCLGCTCVCPGSVYTVTGETRGSGS